MGFWWGRRFRLPGRMEPWPKLHRAYQARQKRGFLGPRIQSNGFARCAVEPFRQCLIPAITTGQPGNPVLLRQGLAGETACPTSIRSTLRAPFFSPNVETPVADRRSALPRHKPEPSDRDSECDGILFWLVRRLRLQHDAHRCGRSRRQVPFQFRLAPMVELPRLQLNIVQPNVYSDRSNLGELIPRHYRA